MFNYISFLRPPPLHISCSGTLLITPKVANDLCTEPFVGDQDIFYYWTQSLNVAEHPITPKPAKLTTWRLANAYKEIPVPLPPDVREEQSWHLVLTTTQIPGQSHVITLNGAAMGASPFPVISMPVLFVSRKDPARKQEQIQRVYCIPMSDGEPAYLTVREQTSFDLDKVSYCNGGRSPRPEHPDAITNNRKYGIAAWV
jgi:protein N-lysine methyltransferase METTL21D